jgi:hypothetical protein
MVANTSSPELIGIIVDVSNSMRRNWTKKGGKKEPRIETIRDVLNKELKRIQSSADNENNKKKELEVFGLGMGFKRKMLWREQEMGYGTETTLDTPPIEKEQSDVVCDILALIDILPTKAEIDELDDTINNKWNGYAKKLLSEIVIDEDVSSTLLTFVHQSLRITSLKRLRGGLSNRLLGILLTNKTFMRSKHIQRYASTLNKNLEKRALEIERLSQKESERYLEGIHAEAKGIFTNHKDRYRQYVEDTLNEFVDKQTTILLKLLTLGHPVNRVFDSFNEEEVFALANNIYKTLDKDVREKIGRSWLINKGILKYTEKKLSARVDFSKLERLTEESIKKLAWETYLRSFAHGVVNDLFKNTFEKKAKSRFSDWVGLAASREIIRPVEELSNLLPEVFEHELYSDSFMFGSTPIYQAVNLASLRFLDKSFASYKKTLVIISDGEFEALVPRYETDLLKKAGVTILCCYVSDSNVMKRLPVKANPDWPQGANAMFDISSHLIADSELANSLKEEGYKVDSDMKLLFQVNFGDRLERILDAVMGYKKKERDNQTA